MRRTLLKFENIQQVVGSDDIAVILLTDEHRQRALSIVCDETMTRQILLRLQSPQNCKLMLPDEYEMTIYGIHDGQYQVVMVDKNFERSVRMRMSDAVLLNIISECPLYIEEQLMRQQSVPFDENARGVAIPINTMEVRRLNMALQRAIDNENYELASQLRDEIKRRKSPTE